MCLKCAVKLQKTLYVCGKSVRRPTEKLSCQMNKVCMCVSPHTVPLWLPHIDLVIDTRPPSPVGPSQPNHSSPKHRSMRLPFFLVSLENWSDWLLREKQCWCWLGLDVGRTQSSLCLWGCIGAHPHAMLLCINRNVALANKTLLLLVCVSVCRDYFQPVSIILSPPGCCHGDEGTKEQERECYGWMERKGTERNILL